MGFKTQVFHKFGFQNDNLAAKFLFHKTENSKIISFLCHFVNMILMIGLNFVIF